MDGRLALGRRVVRAEVAELGLERPPEGRADRAAVQIGLQAATGGPYRTFGSSTIAWGA